MASRGEFRSPMSNTSPNRRSDIRQAFTTVKAGLRMASRMEASYVIGGNELFQDISRLRICRPGHQYRDLEDSLSSDPSESIASCYTLECAKETTR